MEQQKDKENNFFKAYHNIFKISNLNGKKFSISAKSVYCYLLSFSNAGLDVYPSYNAIAEEFGLTRNAAIKQINNLEEMGLIERVERPGESNIYRVLPINQEAATGRSYAENIGTRHQQPTQIKGEVTAPSKSHIEELETLETDFEDINERKSSFAEDLYFYNSLPIEDTLPQKEVVPVEKEIYPWGSSSVFHQSNGQIDQAAWNWAMQNFKPGQEDKALKKLQQLTQKPISRFQIPDQIEKEEYILPF